MSRKCNVGQASAVLQALYSYDIIRHCRIDRGPSDICLACWAGAEAPIDNVSSAVRVQITA
jgi:hypothetical protein